MLTRRDLIRLLSVTPVAVPLLSACGSSSSPDGKVTSVELVRSGVARASGSPRAASAAADSITALAGKLYGELAAEPGNVVFSPYSISVALAMTLNGAAGTTADEMRRVLAIDDLASFNGGLNALTQRLDALPGRDLALDTANSLWGQAGVTWERSFLDLVAREYGTGMHTADYAEASEDARRVINKWTAGQTHDKIPELIPYGVLDEMTRLVLVNAIYLKAPWLAPFEEHLTDDAAFHLTDGSVVDVPMMAGSDASFAHAQGEGWESVRLPYAGGGLAMTVVLPDDVDTVVERVGIAPLLGWSSRDSVGLRLPRWRFRQQSTLNEVLAALGMPTAFTGAADFSGMTHDMSLAISAVVHEAYVAVDEKGTEAAAATAVAIDESAARIEPRVVTVDRPFVFVIHDVRVNTPLFVGRVMNPLS